MSSTIPPVGCESEFVNQIDDNYDYDLKHTAELPTKDKVGEISPTVNPTDSAQKWLDEFAKAADQAANVAAVFLPGGIWRDKAVISGDYRTFTGRDVITRMAKVCATVPSFPFRFEM